MKRKTRIKICGITRPEDALLAESLGVDSLGFVFVRKSARFIEPAAAAEILAVLPPFVTPVGLFLDAPPSEIDEAFKAIPSLIPQFHGREPPDDCERWGRGYLKAIGLGGEAAEASQVRRQIDAHEKALAFLFDSNEPGALGGTGHVFDWQQLEHGMNRPLILAGGLSAANVVSAIAQVQPWAVDVSSGVEAQKGIKDAQKMTAFVQAVHTADSA